MCVCILRQENNKHSILDSSLGGEQGDRLQGCMRVNGDVLVLGLNALILSLITPLLMSKNVHVWKNCKELRTFTNLIFTYLN